MQHNAKGQQLITGAYFDILNIRIFCREAKMNKRAYDVWPNGNEWKIK